MLKEILSKCTLILAILFLVICVFPPSQVSASTFYETYLRLDRTTPATSLSGLICSQPASLATEAKVSITFPSDFTINTTLSNWTTATSDLPSGAVVWPGISSTASVISGQTVTFGSGDLVSSSTLYCFRFNGNSSTTGIVGIDKKGTIATKNASSETVDSTNYSLAIVQNDQISLTGTVPARSSDFQLDFSSATAETTISSNETTEYIITYGSNLSYPTSFTLEADWSLGTIPEQDLYSFEIVSYVSGSATYGFGDAIPTVDIAKRKISWKISNFPKKTTDQKVYFRLKTPSSYTTDQNIDFTIRARLFTDSFSLPYKTVSQTYSPALYIQSGVKDLEILGIDVRQIEKSSFSFLIKTSQPTKTTVLYGKTSDLDQSVFEPNFGEQKLISISGLEPLTTYYYKIKVANEKGAVFTTPEIYTVTTASESLFSNLEQENVLISASGITLKNKTSVFDRTSFLRINPHRSMDLFIPFKTGIPVKVFAKIVPSQVLGINNVELVPYLEKIRLLETEANVFSGKIISPPKTGIYDLILEAYDNSEIISQDMLTKIKVIENMKILDNQNIPVEGALVYLEKYAEKERLYEYFPMESFGFKNPVISDTDGSVDIIIPNGQYKIKVNAIGYQPYETVFSFSSSFGPGYPQIKLIKEPFSILSYFSYIQNIASDMFNLANFDLDKVSSSHRFFDLIILLACFLLSIMNVLFISYRLGIHFEDLIMYLDKYWQLITRRTVNPSSLVSGLVENSATGLPIHAASVILTSADNQLVAARGLTNLLGEFHLKAEKDREYTLLIRKKGYTIFHKKITRDGLNNTHNLYQLEEEKIWRQGKIIDFMIVISASFIYLFSDILFFLVIISSILLVFRLGFFKTIPLLLITIFNILLWMEFVWSNWQEKKLHRA